MEYTLFVIIIYVIRQLTRINNLILAQRAYPELGNIYRIKFVPHHCASYKYVLLFDSLTIYVL